MNILVIGSGGREHALCWKLAQSKALGTLYCAPGNPGIAAVATCIALDSKDHKSVIAFCQESDIGLVVVGPEQPLVEGLADSLSAAHIRCFGPSAVAAQLEGSKGFTKDLCKKYNIPTAAYSRFADLAAAKAYVSAQGAPIVIKADGLAAGKGVVVAATLPEAHAALDDMFSGQFGSAGAEVVVEEFMEGEEASFFALCDGKTALPLATAQDHKRVGDHDTGPNTGGMGAYSPAPIMTPDLIARTMAEIIEPTVKAMADAGAPYVGVLYAGLMITHEGPKLIEYNCRFGDPETQVLMMRLESDLLMLMLAACDGALDQIAPPQWRSDPALTVVMAARGYPGEPLKGTEIQGLEKAKTIKGVEIFHAGTRAEHNPQTGQARLLSNGGRVLNITALGETVAQAQSRAYAAIDSIHWPEGFCRRDIGYRAIAREQRTPL